MMLVNLLDHYSIIEISGEDHLDFLQGQLTNDVKKIEKKFIYSGMCNPKGRLFAFLRILRVPDLNSTFLVIPSSLADTCLLYTSPSPRDLSTSRMPSSA